MPTTPLRPRRLAPTALLGLSCVLLAACGGAASKASTPGTPPAVPSPTPSPRVELSAEDRAAEDLAAVRAAGDKAEAAGSASYRLYLIQRQRGDTGYYISRRAGQLVPSSGTHQVLQELPDARRGHEGELLSLTFLYTPTEVLMNNASITSRTGRTWTRLPQATLQQFAGTFDHAHLPLGTLLDEAHGPVHAVAPGYDARGHIVQVPEAAALVLASVAPASLQAKGVDLASLPLTLTHDVEVQVFMDAQGRLSRVYADVTQLYADLAVLQHGDPVPDGTTLAAEMFVEDIDSTTVVVPPASDIADYPRKK